VDAFFFQFVSGADAFPGGSDFDEDAVAIDAIFFITRDERARFGEGGLGVKAETRVDFGAYAAGHDFQNLEAKKHREFIQRIGHIFSFGGYFAEQLGVLGHLRGFQDEAGVGGGVLRGEARMDSKSPVSATMVVCCGKESR